MSERSRVEVSIRVAHGRVIGHQGVRFGGIACVPAADGKPSSVRVAIRGHNGELLADLPEGATIQVAGQTWRLGRIHSDGRSWHACLIRVS